MKKAYTAVISFPTVTILFCVTLYVFLFWRYDAFPWEKRIVKKIERTAFGEKYKNNDLDYCIPYRGMPVCSANFLETYPPGTQCHTPRCAWGHVTVLSLYVYEDLPFEEIAKLPGLKYLYLGSNQLSSLPPEIGQLQHLKELDLSENWLTSLPPEIGELRNVTSLNLSDNQLTNLPPEIGQLDNLSSLNLSKNQLESLPPEIGKLSSLTYLDLNDNPLSGSLPNFLVNLPLKHFEFLKTDLCVPVDEEVQEWIKKVSTNYYYGSPLYNPSNLCSLTKEDESAMLALYKTPGRPADWSIQSFPCTWSGVNCDLAGHVVELYVRLEKSQDETYITNLTTLPPEIGDLAYLRTLFLSNNNLTELPPEIGGLQSLSYLELSGNKLASLPPEISQLTNLHTLLLDENQLTELPPEIGRLKKLELLNVDFNPLSGPLPLFLTQIPDVYFAFYNTELCIPDDERILDWLIQQIPNSPQGYIYQDGKLVPMDRDATHRILIKNKGCK